MGAAENQRQVFRKRPQPLEIAARFPHSHRPDDYAELKLQNEESGRFDDAVEKWKSKSTISTFPPHRQPAAQGRRLISADPDTRSKSQQKGGLAAGRFAPAFRLILG
jgi:hypothetical protein